MPPIRVAQHARPGPVEPHAAFAFPKDHHLVITTETNVWSWDHHGLTNAFASGSGGILAAKEAKDGSGLLAVADDQVVVLHDTNRGMDRSYRLKGTDGQIRLLEYSNDSKNLFFTTTLQNAVQSYSLRQACLLEPSHIHPSPPTVLAISSTSHLLLSASENPPTIFLQNLTLRTPALQLQPRASAAAVETASFHPERPNVFLLAFKDGTLAAYDATRILGRAGRGGSGGEVSRFKSLHTVTNRVLANSRGETGDDPRVIGNKSVSITSAIFLPGHRSRAVSVGADGRCRLVDFECGGNILRTWHAKGPATSLSVLSVRQKQSTLVRPAVNRAEMGALTNTLAVGREDGKVLVFDSVGILLSEQTVDVEAGRILDVAWMKGPGLKPDTKPPKARSLSESSDPWARASPSVNEPEEVEEEFDEEDSGTVNHTPMEASGNRPVINAMNYMDLFSPVKPAPNNSPQRRSPRARARPRILSSTFRQSSLTSSPQTTAPRLSIIPQLPRPDEEDERNEPEPVDAKKRNFEARLAAKLPSPNRRAGSPRRAPPSQEIKVAKTPNKTPRVRKGRRVSARMPGSVANTSGSHVTTATSSSNSKILADIKRLGESSGKKKTGLALLAPYIKLRYSPRSGSPAMSETSQPEPKVESVKPKSAPTPDDIWLTSDDEGSMSRSRTRSRRQLPQRSRLANLFQTEQPSHGISENASAVWESENDENVSQTSSRPLLSPKPARSPSQLNDHLPRTNSPRAMNVGSSRATLGDIDFNTVHSPHPHSGQKSRLITSELLEDAHGSEQHDENGCDCGKNCCAALRKDVRNLREDLRLLREDMALMRALLGH